MKAWRRCGLSRTLAVAVAGLLALGPGTARAGTIYVSTSGNDSYDGLTWPTAKATVQAGLNAAVAGDEVWVAAGTYVGCITLKAEVALYGGFAGGETDLSQRDWTANETILDGNQAGSVVTVQEGATLATRIDGFTIRGGSGTMVNYSLPGGGIYCSYSSLTITNNVITGNTATAGGGIFCSFANAVIADNAITDNILPDSGAGSGGGIWCYNSSVMIADNSITGNIAGQNGGGVCCFACDATILRNTISGNIAPFGGGIGGSGTILNNTIENNVARASGGGISNSLGGSAIISGNTITGNHAAGIGGGIHGYGTITDNTISDNTASSGGGIYCINTFSPTTISNNKITGNTASTTNGDAHGGGVCGGTRIDNNVIAGNTAALGGGIYGGGEIDNNMIAGNTAALGGGIYTQSGKIVSNTIVGNVAQYSAGGIALLGLPTVADTIVAFNSSGVLWADTSGAPALRHNCVYGNADYNYSGLPDPTGTGGNISADPLFVRPASSGPDGTWGTADDDYGDLRLLPFSPCIDAGNNADVPADTADLDGDGNVTEPLPFDLAGGARFLDDPQVADTGTGTPPIVDMGAYERCRPIGDVDGDWLTDVVDLLYVVGAFGTSSDDPAYDARCDFNSDGAVDVADLLDLVYSFGK